MTVRLGLFSRRESVPYPMHHVLYKTTCKTTGRFYLGRHSTKNLQDGYLGSGHRLRRSVAKHGRDAHFFEILEHLPDKAALVAREREVVNAALTDPMCMNIREGGEGGWDAASRTKAHESFRRHLEDPSFKAEVSKQATRAGSLVTAEGRKNCSEALKLRYQDPEFKARQIERLKQANAARREGKRVMNQLNAIKGSRA